MALSLDDISTLFIHAGAAQYGGEAITQLQHALQCAHLAELHGASEDLIAAALLHDLGHLLAVGEPPQQAVEGGPGDDRHQYAALPFLRSVFPDAVLEPIRLHVDAKRYLCCVDEAYWASLSPASKRSLQLQGGVFSSDESEAFINKPFAADAVALRRWDDLAKNPDTAPPQWPHYASVLERVAKRPLVTA
jgi:phosphonate degradation associated HDIG domain protein